MLPPPYCVTGPQWVKEWHTMLDPAKPIDGSQPGYQTISINRWTISEVDVLPCGILLGRLHHGSTEAVSVAGSLFCLLPMWWVNNTWTASYKDLALQEDSRYTRNTIYIFSSVCVCVCVCVCGGGGGGGGGTNMDGGGGGQTWTCMHVETRSFLTMEHFHIIMPVW